MKRVHTRLPARSDHGKIVSAADAVGLIHDRDTIATSAHEGLLRRVIGDHWGLCRVWAGWRWTARSRPATCPRA